MNNLEFINLEIAITRTRLKEHNKFAQTQLAIKDEKRLQTLQQIKDELEAWEVIKEELQIVFKGKNYYGEPLRRYEVNVIGQNKIDTLNKALEVKDKC